MLLRLHPITGQAAFVQAAWGLDYVPDVSGLVATDLGNGEWFVLVSELGADETPFVEQGLFVQTGDGEHIALFNWDEDLLAEAGLLSVEHTFMPGVLTGSSRPAAPTMT